MISIEGLMLTFLCGVILGGIFFVGLWWTVRRALLSTRPGVLLSVSFLLRMGTLCIGFLLLGRSQWQYFLSCLCGLLCARMLTLRILKPPHEEKAAPHEREEGGRHAHQSR
jgi:F1F0 ATPase subunit 2